MHLGKSGHRKIKIEYGKVQNASVIGVEKPKADIRLLRTTWVPGQVLSNSKAMMTDYQEEWHKELEALESIYPDSFPAQMNI
ncbi:hypothetical protein MC885_014148, partial [Smutsia gigantea]